MNFNIHLDKFALRHFTRDFSGTKILNISPDQFLKSLLSYDIELIDSKMDFCKYIIISNLCRGSLSLLITSLSFRFLI